MRRNTDHDHNHSKSINNAPNNAQNNARHRQTQQTGSSSSAHVDRVLLFRKRPWRLVRFPTLNVSSNLEMRLCDRSRNTSDLNPDTIAAWASEWERRGNQGGRG